MMKSSRLEKDKKKKKIEGNIIKDVKNRFWSKNKIDGTTIKYIRNLFRFKLENEAIKGRIIGDTENAFEHEEDYYRPVRIGRF